MGIQDDEKENWTITVFALNVTKRGEKSGLIKSLPTKL